MTSPLSLLDRIRQRLADVPQVVEKKMFGATAFLVNDKMCINATERELMVRIDPAQHDELAAREGCRTVVMNGKPYRGYIDVDGAVLETDAALEEWVRRALAYNNSCSCCSSRSPHVPERPRKLKRHCSRRMRAPRVARMSTLSSKRWRVTKGHP